MVSVLSAASLSLSAINGSNGFRLDGAAAADVSGFSVSSGGDVNGDLIVEAYSDLSGPNVIVEGNINKGTASDFEIQLNNISSLANFDESDFIR